MLRWLPVADAVLHMSRSTTNGEQLINTQTILINSKWLTHYHKTQQRILMIKHTVSVKIKNATVCEDNSWEIKLEKEFVTTVTFFNFMQIANNGIFKQSDKKMFHLILPLINKFFRHITVVFRHSWDNSCIVVYNSYLVLEQFIFLKGWTNLNITMFLYFPFFVINVLVKLSAGHWG